MSKAAIEGNLRKYKKEYLDYFYKLETTDEFKDLSRSARGTGMFFQYHESVREAIVERAKISGKRLRQGIYDKIKKDDPELIANLEKAMEDASSYLATTTIESWKENEELREMLRSLRETYLPQET